MSSSKESAPTPSQVVAELQRVKASMSDAASKISGLEAERDEHQLVVDTLQPLDPKRKCFRLVSGILVERSVGDVLPAVSENIEGIRRVIGQLQTAYKKKEAEFIDIQTKYGHLIPTQ